MVCTSPDELASTETTTQTVVAPPLSDDAVWEAYFAERNERPQRHISWWLRIAGMIIAFAVFGSAVTAAVQAIRYLTRISEPEAIIEHADSYVDESTFGFLVTGVEVMAIDAPDVGAFVRANPADGVITIDIRPWEGPGLDRIVAHEIGHLIDFALQESADGDPQVEPFTRGGLPSEVWAECAAVAADTRGVDKSSKTGEYRCRADEFKVFESVMESVEEICVPWRRDVQCQPVIGSK